LNGACEYVPHARPELFQSGVRRRAPSCQGAKDTNNEDSKKGPLCSSCAHRYLYDAHVVYFDVVKMKRCVHPLLSSKGGIDTYSFFGPLSRALILYCRLSHTTENDKDVKRSFDRVVNLYRRLDPVSVGPILADNDLSLPSIAVKSHCKWKPSVIFSYCFGSWELVGFASVNDSVKPRDTCGCRCFET
jgi:hypothetical protein